MKNRLNKVGKLLNRKKKISFFFDNKVYFGYEGDTLASALLANDVILIARSFKYHRPRGVYTCGIEEPNALVSVGEKNSFEPNVKATTVRIYEGMISKSQNCWPSLQNDFGFILSKFSTLFPAGFYYKTFMFPTFAWKSIYEPVIRQISGLGNPPKQKDNKDYEFFYSNIDLLIVGGGISGLRSAHHALSAGMKVMIIEQSSFLGGRSLIDENEIEGVETNKYFENLYKNIKKSKNFVIKLNTTVTGLYDHGFVLANEKIINSKYSSLNCRLWKIRAKKIVLATGAIERPIIFENNDLPGNMLSSALRDYLNLYGVCPGKNIILFTNNDDAYKTALVLVNNNKKINYIIDLRPKKENLIIKKILSHGIKVFFGYTIRKAYGKKRIEAISIIEVNKKVKKYKKLKCDLLGVSGGWSPVINLWSHPGGKIFWNERNETFFPKLDSFPKNSNGTQNTIVVGSASGLSRVNDCINQVSKKINAFIKNTDQKIFVDKDQFINSEKNSKNNYDYFFENLKNNHGMTFVDMQNDVKISDLNLAVLEGFENIEHVKRYTTLGMATDQGKLSNINGTIFLSNLLGKKISDVGLPKFRPPYTPLNLGSIAGEAKGKLFKPTRKTSIDKWHEEKNAIFEPVGDWRRPLIYKKDGIDFHSLVSAEVLGSRNSVGIFDASTLGKILVHGKDSGKFLDLIYTNIISSLEINTCKYGLICNENGFLFDDGVVAKIDDNTFLCHTTSGGEEKVYSWMEEWLQTEFFNFNVRLLNVTEQFSQITLSGPNSYKLLCEATSKDFTNKKIPFMTFVNCKIFEYQCRVYRISFTGDLSFEISISNSVALSVWEKLISLGKKFDIVPFGTEALHVMRAEKGFIMIGEETDGTVTPDDLNLSWAVSKKKKDFIGKRGLERNFLNSNNRKKLVGLKSTVSDIFLPQGAVIKIKKSFANTSAIVGYVTSSYYSPTLKKNIAMALLSKKCIDTKQELFVVLNKNSEVKVKVINYMLFDPKGKKLYG